MRRTLLFLVGLFALLVAPPVATRAVAQGVDVIRGRVTGPDNQPLEGVQITVTSLSGNVNRQTRSDRNGRYTVTFPGGEGDYFVNFAAIGYAPRRFEVKRTADQDILVADAKLQAQASTLDAVKVTAPREKVARGDNPADVGGSEKTINTSGLTAAQMGDLAAMAASLPGVTLIPGADGDPSGFSVLGLGQDQNNTTLNGANFGGANLPRDAAVSSSLVTAPYDVSRGGFSGGQFSIRTRPGTNFIGNALSLNLDSPKLQWTDKAARSLGQQYSNISLGGSVTGPVKTDVAFYNMSYQLGRRSNDLATLLNTDPLGLQTSGIAADSVTRLLNILNTLRIPAAVGRVPSDRLSDQGSILAAFDIAPPSSKTGAAYNMTFTGSWNKQSPASSSLLSEMPAHSGDRTSWNASVQGRHSAYIGNFLSETTVNLSDSRNFGTPYLVLPSGTVRVNSTLADGTNGVKTVAFGGSPALATSQGNTSIGASNQISWFSLNNKHRVKFTSELRRDDYTLDQSVNQLGSLSFNSLAELSSGTAATFSRLLSPRKRSGGEYVAAMSLGDSWKVSSDFQLQYGLRLDGNQFIGGPTYNPQVDALFGVRNDHIPNRVYASPRVGFSWQYGEAPQVAGFEGAVRGPRAVVRGGIGIFQNMPGSTTMGGAIDNTGLSTGLQQLTCVGVATPVVDWAAWATNAALIPSQCATGTSGSVFSSTAPNVSMFAKDFAAPRSLRSNLNWTGPILNNLFNASFEGTYSLNMNQAAAVDLNFAPVQRFTLTGEGNRPIYVLPTSIDPASGAIAARDARITQAYNRVNETRSDLQSESKQFRASLSPTSFSTNLTWNLSYVWSSNREKVRGFTSTVGNPLEIEWARSTFDSRHQIQYSLNYNFFDAVRVSWFGNVRSGSPYTPQIAGDVNGDGYSNDRAFVFNPATAADPAVATAMTALLKSATGNAKDCLSRQLGRLAERNSCEGPWTHTASMSVSFNPLKIKLPQRATFSLSIANPLGAADLLLNGEKNLKGWGQTPFPDANLLYVRGFDATTQRFKYEVNQRFGSTNPAFTSVRQPVVVTAMLRYDLAPTRERQMLTQQLDRGRRTNGTKAVEPILRAMYQNGGLVNPIATILRQSDTLRLTQKQADSLATLNRWYSIRVDSIWTPLAKYFAGLPDKYDEGEVYARYITARQTTIDILIKLGPEMKRLMTAEQVRKLPPFIASYLDVRYLASIRSGTAGAGGNTFLPGGGGTTAVMGGGMQSITIVR
jgi:hypothetical protein